MWSTSSVLVKAGKTKAGKQMLKWNGTIWSLKRRMEIRCFTQLLKLMYMNPLLFVCVTNIFISLKIWSVPYVLHHEIEMDETYVTHCRKGRFIKDHPARSGDPCFQGRFVRWESVHNNSSATPGKMYCTFAECIETFYKKCRRLLSIRCQ